MNLVKRLSVVIVNYRTPELAVACVQSLEPARLAFADLQTIVVDGGSDDESAAILTEALAVDGRQEWAELLALPVNGGFGYANNQALLALAERGPLPDYVALINPDARVLPGALEAMAAVLDREPDCGAVGGQLVHDDGSTQSSAFHFPSLGGEFCRGARTGFIDRLLRQPPRHIQLDKAGPVPWVTGASVMFRSTALQQAGLFDDGFFLYFEETELMYRLRARGWAIWHEPLARVMHEGGAATQIRDPKTGTPLEKPMPRYWYHARRRYFALTGGRLYAVAAGLAWLGGTLFWRLRRIVTGKAEGSSTQRALRDMFIHGLWARRHDSSPAVQAFSGVAGQPPSWTKFGK
jgi:N-acetylglucosaminyl-diphospho-decaprenol L-rhamnosyltransferase